MNSTEIGESHEGVWNGFSEEVGLELVMVRGVKLLQVGKEEWRKPLGNQ